MHELPPGEAQQSDGRPAAQTLPRLRVNAKLRRQTAAGCAAGAASAFAAYLAFPPADLGLMGFVALVPLFVVFRRGAARPATAASLTFGLLFFGLLISWIRLFGLPAYAALVLLQTAIVAATLTVGHLLVRRGSPSWLVFPVAFLAGEYLRSRFPFGGFAWGGLGYAAHDHPSVLRLASYTGVWGLTVLMTATTVLIVEATCRFKKSPKTALQLSGVGVIALIVPAILPAGSPKGPAARIAMVQADVPENTFDPNADDLAVLRSHVQLSKTLKTSPPALVVWAESAFDRDPLADPEFAGPLRETIREINAPFLVGAILDSPNPLEGEIQNVSLLFRPDSSLGGIYVKQQPVPFGERVYFRRLLEPLIDELQRVPRDMAPGTKATTFTLPQGKFASVICYESTYPSLVREMVNKGAGLLVVSTNNSSYARTAASRQHVAFSQVRAAEHRMWVAHTALSGISAVVAPDGKILQRTSLFEPGVMVPEVRFAKHRTFYAITGDWVPVAALGTLAWLAALQAGASLAKRRSSPNTDPGEVKGGVLVVIPTFNEAEHVEKVVEILLNVSPGVAVLVVDDGSPDGTGAIAQKLSAQDNRIAVMIRESKRGLGSAYIDGFRWGLERGFDQFVEMDADLSHDPADVARLIAAAGPRRVVLGSRYVPGGTVTGWSKWRHLLSRTANLYARVMLRLPVKDSTSGFRCFPRGALEQIALETIESEGYAFQIEMAYRAHRLGYEVAEIPIAFQERRSGRSKMSSAIVVEAIVSVARWAVSYRINGGIGIRRKRESSWKKR